MSGEETIGVEIAGVEHGSFNVVNPIISKIQKGRLTKNVLYSPVKTEENEESLEDDDNIKSRYDHHEENTAELTIDEMKIQTMYKMVDDVEVSADGIHVTKKVLYLTNHQADLFNPVNMARCVQALDLGEPKFVIHLLPSYGVLTQFKIAHGKEAFNSKLVLDPNYGFSEIDNSDAKSVEAQVLHLMRNCILPLAIQTSALILVDGANDCFLTAALASVALQEQARLGPSCPFKIVAISYEHEINQRAISDPKSLAYQIASGSDAWKRRIKKVGRSLNQLHKLPEQCDLTPAASHFIIFESLDFSPDGKCTTNHSPKSRFEATFLECFAHKLPSICIQAFNCGEGFHSLTDFLSRGIPLLLLDTSQRTFTMRSKFDGPKKESRKKKEPYSFPDLTPESIERIYGGAKNNSLSQEGKLELLQIAMKMIEGRFSKLIENGHCDAFDTSSVALLHSALELGNDFVTTSESVLEGDSKGAVSLYTRLCELETAEKTNRDAEQTAISSELISEAIDFLNTKVAAFQKQAKLAAIEKWFKSNPHVLENAEAAEEVLKIKNAQKTLVEECAAIVKDGHYFLSADLSRENWLAYNDIFSSVHTFSRSIFEIDEVKRVISKVAKLERVTFSNSLESLYVLQDAWNHVEIYHQVASSYKTATKISYLTLLLVSILVTLFSILETQYEVDSRPIIMALSFFGSCIAGYITYMNPALRWQQLRMAALSIESNIWTFRMRVGTYRTSANSSLKLLADYIQDIKATVLDGADIKNTAFYSTAVPTNAHGQNRCPDGQTFHPELSNDENSNKNSKSHILEILESAKIIVKINKDINNPDKMTVEDVIAWITEDDDAQIKNLCNTHYEGFSPDAYIDFRIKRAVRFYKQRIPSYSLTRHIAQAFMVLGSIGYGVLAFAGLPIWGALLSIAISTVAALIEFQGVSGKISRYSFTVHSLQNLIVWWQSIPSIDKANLDNIDRLVITGEELLQREQQSWKSTSQAVKMLQKQAKPDAISDDDAN